MLRFAPSPTGLLHVGNARIALLNYLFAMNNKIKFLLRIDDTDKERSKIKYVDAIKTDLGWMGIKYNDLFYQSKRMKNYFSACEQLKNKGRLYACYETPEELELKRKIQLKTGKPPVYDRSSLRLSKKEIKNYENEGRKPHWRLFLDEKAIEWKDYIHKKIRFEKLSISDPILIRSDNTPLFTLTSVVDDAEFKISHILRGDDHITNTAAQIKLFQYLDADIPNFGHFPLMMGTGGESMSKRLNSFSLVDIRNKKINPDVINTLLAKIGTSSNFEEIKDIETLKDEFSLSKYSKNPIYFNFDDLNRLNGKFIRGISYNKIKKLVNEDFNEEFWEAIKLNIKSLEDISFWMDIVYKNNLEVNVKEQDKEIIEIAKLNLPKELNSDTWSIWTTIISKLSGKKGKEVFLPLRFILTGLKSGPEMNLIIPLLNREEILRRLNV